ncbi:hypothetical protein Cni_G20978 [Canna indica]|uniref:Uncharacterized protein n=1 Tax=Canna indica TaxID=4628 RepID=A0AAQ3KUY5_9LILI|nr:hypothetical protein Cni_G20978 [Canna indica]
MDEFSAPSFSLGLDLDIADLSTEGEEEDEKEEAEEEQLQPLLNRSSAPENPTVELFRDEELEDGEAFGSKETPNPEPIQETPLSHLKRLRRGPPPPRRSGPLIVDGSPLDIGGGGPEDAFTLIDDDDIEEFSSPEDNASRDTHSSVRSSVLSGASKFSLQNHGVLARKSTKLMAQKISPASDAAASTVSHENNHKKLFAKPNITPIRKIYLLSSDSDSSSNEDGCMYDNKAKTAKLRHKNPIIENEEESCFNYRNPKEDSFWKDFSPRKNINLATPALDQFCDEYFKSMGGSKSEKHREEETAFCTSGVIGSKKLVDNIEENCGQKSITGETNQKCKLPNSAPPAFQYFYHDDIRIQMLVKQRLCYFVPLGAEVQKQPGIENLNYMCQFETRDVHSRAGKTRKRTSEGSSIKGKNPKVSCRKEPSNATGGWTNPRDGAAIAKDAGKRRVSADGHPSDSGHWFTQDGKKVYVTKKGQELTGRIAYRQYRKESGAGFRKSRKKAAPGRKKK